MTKTEFTEYLQPLVNRFRPKDLDIDAYYSVLELYEDEDIKQGITTWRQTQYKFPSTNELLGYVFCATDKQDGCEIIDKAYVRTSLVKTLKTLLDDFLHGRITKDEMLQRAEDAKIKHGFDTSKPRRKMPDEIFEDEYIKEYLVTSYFKKRNFVKSRTQEEEQEALKAVKALKEFEWYLMGIDGDSLIVKGISDKSWQEMG